MRGIKFIPDTIDLNVMGWRKVSFAITAALVLLSVLLVFQRGLNDGVDFSGGALLEVRTPEAIPVQELRSDMGELGIGAVFVRTLDTPDHFLIRVRHQGQLGTEADKAAIERVRFYLDTRFEGEEEESLVDYLRVEFVGPEVGEELKTKGVYAVLLALLGILVYIWVRFEWRFGVAALVALGFDVITTLGFFALTQMEFNLVSVAAVLMIVGYSINDTVIIFDRVREMLKKYKHMPIFEILNLSVNRTLSRTIMTTFSTLLALAGLFVFGGELMSTFVYALIFGMVVGVYSSVYVAAPLLALMGLNRNVAAHIEGDAPAENREG